MREVERDPSDLTAYKFLRCMQGLQTLAPESRLLKILGQWVETEMIDEEDRKWLNQACGRRSYQLNEFDVLDPNATVMERHHVDLERDWSQGQQTTRFLEATGASYFIEYLQGHYWRYTMKNSSGRSGERWDLRPRIKRCLECEAFFLTLQGFPGPEFCTKKERQRHWDRENRPQPPSSFRRKRPRARQTDADGADGAPRRKKKATRKKARRSDS